MYRVATNSPVKLQAVRRALRKLGVQSRVESAPYLAGPEQPFGWNETIRLARRRARACRGLGIEAGIVRIGSEWFNVTVCAVYGKGKTHLGIGPAFRLPAKILKRVRHGATLSEAFDNPPYGAIGVLSGGRIKRVDLVEAAVLMALTASTIVLK